MKLNLKNPKYEWTVVQKTDFVIQVKAWKYGEMYDEWIWNIYVLIFDTHPLFKEENREAAKHSIPFHGGCTYDSFNTTGPLLGIEYDWQKEASYIKVGNDYNHYGDSFFTSCDPKDGIPWSIEKDISEIYEVLEGWPK